MIKYFFFSNDEGLQLLKQKSHASNVTTAFPSVFDFEGRQRLVSMYDIYDDRPDWVNQVVFLHFDQGKLDQDSVTGFLTNCKELCVVVHGTNCDLETLKNKCQENHITLHVQENEHHYGNYFNTLSKFFANNQTQEDRRVILNSLRDLMVNFPSLMDEVQECKAAVITALSLKNEVPNIKAPLQGADCLIIWDEDSESQKLLFLIESIWNERGRLKTGTVIICSADALQQQLNLKKRGYKKVYILAELDWERAPNQSILHGYDVFKILVEAECFDFSEDFEIMFYSTISRKRALDISLKKHTYTSWLIRKFPFCEIEVKQNKEANGRQSVNVALKDCTDRIKISKNKYNLLKHQCLQEAGRIDKLLHDFRYCTKEQDITDVHRRFIQDMKCSKTYFVSKPSLIDIIDKLDKKNLQIGDWKKHEDEIGTLLKSLEDPMHDNWQNMTTSLLESTKILLVEDHSDLRDSFATWLKNQGAEVEAVASGTEAFRRLKLADRQYHLICADLELLDKDGFDDPIQGIDLIEHALGKKIPIRIITTMPKRTASSFFTGIPILYKKDFESVFVDRDQCKGFLKDIQKEVKKYKRQYSAVTMPSTANYSDHMKSIYLDRQNKGTLDENINDVKNNAIEFFANKDENIFIPSGLTVKKQYSFEAKFVSLLTHRLIVLISVFKEGLSDNSNEKFNYINYATNKKISFGHRSSFLDADRILSSNPKALLTTSLGFKSGSQQSLKTTINRDDPFVFIKIDPNEQYPHENEILEELKELSEEARKEKYGF